MKSERDQSVRVQNRYFVAVMLAIVSMFSQTDRYLLSFLLDPMRRELGVRDVDMGLLTGLGFAVVYATTALPTARWADRGNRRNIIALAVCVWSASTAVCALAVS